MGWLTEIGSDSASVTADAGGFFFEPFLCLWRIIVVVIVVVVVRRQLWKQCFVAKVRVQTAWGREDHQEQLSIQASSFLRLLQKAKLFVS